MIRCCSARTMRVPMSYRTLLASFATLAFAASGLLAILDASAQPTVGPEIALDTPISGLQPALPQESPRPAFDGTNYLVAWRDDRGGGSIVAAGVSPSGVILDPNGIVLRASMSLGGNFGGEPAVACGGATCLVVWYAASPALREYQVEAARVSVQGQLL